MSDLIFTDEIKCTLIGSYAHDSMVVSAARISLDRAEFNDEDAASVSNDEAKLIAFLMRNKHGTPFEHNMFKFLVEAPIFVFREHHRHRIGHSYNEMSGRYTELEPKFYVPRCARVQHGKPGAYTFSDGDDGATARMRATVIAQYKDSWFRYQALLERGIAKEQARMVLPVGIYTKMVWTTNARGLMSFLALRDAPQAQAEIRQVASQAGQALARLMPVTYEAFRVGGSVAP